MIISRTPLRVSFFGGGSDLPAYYRRHGGAVLSTAIDKSVYVTVSRKFDDAVRVSYSRTEEVARAADVEHPLVREALALLGVEGGVEITSVADIPRSFRSFRLISIRPLLSVVFVPSAPMNEEIPDTAGSASSTFAISCCRCAISVNEVEGDACVMPWMMPVSCVGKNPLGISMYKKTVRTSVATATSSVIV